MDFLVWIRVFTIGAALGVLAGCDVTQDMAIDKAMDIVASTLKDADSAKFQRVFMVEEQVIGDAHYGMLCGEVNSRNSFGGFTGFRRFVANFNYSKQGSIGVSYVTIEEGDNASLNREGVSYFHQIYWLGKCEPRPAQAKVELAKADLPAPAPSKPEAKKPAKVAKTAPTKESQWAVQVASMSDAAQAINLQKKMAADGLASYTTTKDGKTRVFVGPFAERGKADTMIGELRTKQLLKGFVIRVEQ